MSSRQSGRRLQDLVFSPGGVLLAVLVIAVVVTWATVLRGGDSQADSSDAGATVSTGSSQLPTGPIRVAGVEVLEPVSDAGRVPLNTPVERTWHLRNTGTIAVKLGRPGIQVLEGC